MTTAASATTVGCGANIVTTTQFAKSVRECSERRERAARAPACAPACPRHSPGSVPCCARPPACHVVPTPPPPKHVRAPLPPARPPPPPPPSPPTPHPARAGVAPGYGWVNGDAVECAEGSYNPGFNTRACTRCPGSLTTESTRSNSTAACLADRGHYYLRGKAVACAQGTYKDFQGQLRLQRMPRGRHHGLQRGCQDRCCRLQP